MSLPIEWNPEAGLWVVKNPLTGAALWRGAQYGDAAQFADDYQSQQQAAVKADAMSKGLK